MSAELTAFGVALAVELVKHAAAETGLAARVRDLLGRDATQDAVAKAATRALRQLAEEYPSFSASLFDDNFVAAQAPLLAALVTRTGRVEPSQLAQRWSEHLGASRATSSYSRVRAAEPVAAYFLESFSAALANEPALAGVADARGTYQLLTDVAALRAALAGSKATLGSRIDYLEWLIARNLYLDVRGTLQTQRQVQLRLTDVYLPLTALTDVTNLHPDKPKITSDLIELQQPLRLSAKRPGELEGQTASLQEQRRVQSPAQGTSRLIGLPEFVMTHQSVAVLGDPGSGKTTLLRHLALTLAEQCLVNIRLGRDDSPRLPVLIRVAAYAEGDLRDGRSLTDSLEALHARAECPTDAVQDLLETELSSGGCLVLLDGLDEVVNADERRSVVRQIEDFVRRHAARGNKFVVSSRVAGYETAALAGDFVHCLIQDMERSQQELFLRRWCNAVEDAETPDLPAEERRLVAAREITGVMHAIDTSPGVARLATNPLMLRILALIHRTGAVLPDKRIELYKLSADTLARTWRLAQGVPETALIKDEFLTRLLGSLANWLHATKPTGVATHDEVVHHLAGEYARLKGVPHEEDAWNLEIHTEVENFLVAVRIQTGIFVERAPRRYGFMHLTFEEYYAARHLISIRRRSAAGVRSRLHDPRWEEPILLALGFMGLDYPEDASELIEEAILGQGALPLRPHDVYEGAYLGWDFLFVLRCLADHIPVERRLAQDLFDRAFRDLTAPSGAARFARYNSDLVERLRKLTVTSNGQYLIGRLIEAADSGDAVVSRRALKAMLRIAPFDEAVLSMVGRMSVQGPQARSALAEALRDASPFDDIADGGLAYSHMLLRLMGDPDPNTAANALRYIDGFEDWPPELLKAAVPLLQTEDDVLRKAATEAVAGRSKAPEVHAYYCAELASSLTAESEVDHLLRHFQNKADLESEALNLVLRAAVSNTNSDLATKIVVHRSASSGTTLRLLMQQGMWALPDLLSNVVSKSYRRRPFEEPVTHPVDVAEYLKTGTNEQRAFALFLLAEFGSAADEEVQALAVSGLVDACVMVRRVAAMCAVKFSAPAELLEALAADDEEDDDVRSSALTALLPCGADRAVAAELVRSCLSGKGMTGRLTRLSAMDLLRGEHFSREFCERTAVTHLDDDDDAVAQSAAIALGLLPNLRDDTQRQIERLLKGTRASSKRAAASAARVGAPSLRREARQVLVDLETGEVGDTDRIGSLVSDLVALSEDHTQALIAVLMLLAKVNDVMVARSVLQELSVISTPTFGEAAECARLIEDAMRGYDPALGALADTIFEGLRELLAGYVGQLMQVNLR